MDGEGGREGGRGLGIVIIAAYRYRMVLQA